MYIPVVPPQPPTQEARDLGGRLAETIHEFQQSHRHLTTADVRQALKLAQEQTGASAARVATKAVIAGLLAFFGLGVFAYRRMGDAGPEQWSWMAVGIGGVALLIAAIAFIKRDG